MKLHRLSLFGLILCASLAFTQTISPRARAIHDSAIIVDTHADTPQRFLYEHFDIGTTDPKDMGHISLDKARTGNLGAEFFSIWADPQTTNGHFAKSTFDMIDSVYEQAARHPDRMMMAFSVDDIERAHKQKHLAALLGIEGGHSIENDIRLLRDYYRLGVRYMTLSWSNTNDWADSSGDIDDPKVEHHNGLTDFGKEVVLEMNRLGMMVDISHVADKTFFDAIATTKAPVIASHSSARALTNHPRNMTDDMLRALAKNGGVVMINYEASFLSEEYRKAIEMLGGDVVAQRNDMAKKCGGDEACVTLATSRSNHALMDSGRLPRVTWQKVVEHIDHAVKVAGIDHVGLGSDFDGATMPIGMEDASKLPRITDALLKMGYSEQDVAKILGGNILRVMEQVDSISLSSLTRR
jgi:membrane dipeptidase